jgi:hypothetical protein
VFPKARGRVDEVAPGLTKLTSNTSMTDSTSKHDMVWNFIDGVE